MNCFGEIIYDDATQTMEILEEFSDDTVIINDVTEENIAFEIKLLLRQKN